jgi:hypothetical protein
MLFDLKEDPYESVNLAEKKPELCTIARKKYEEWHENMMETMPAGWGDPMDTVLEEGGPHHARGAIKTKAYDQRLQATGRGEAIYELKKRHPDEFE